jgi:hypothetical protein
VRRALEGVVGEGRIADLEVKVSRRNGGSFATAAPAALVGPGWHSLTMEQASVDGKQRVGLSGAAAGQGDPPLVRLSPFGLWVALRQT